MKKDVTITRFYCFLVPLLMDGVLGMTQTSVPFLALSFGATPMFLGILGSFPMALRFPLCLLSGRLSDKVGRAKVILPAALLAVTACVGLALTGSKLQVLFVYTLLMMSVGAFYPALQAFIGDRSPRRELRKNLSFFNSGWTIGGALMTSVSGLVFIIDRRLPFMVGAVVSILVIGVMLLWSRRPVTIVADESDGVLESGPAGKWAPLLFVARIGHFLGFFGYAMVRNLFPKLGLDLGMSEGVIGMIIGMLLVGQAVGMVIIGASDWWRGKLWPQILGQVWMLVAGLLIFACSSKFLLAATMALYGTSQVIVYTGSLYYGLLDRANMGRNTGIHEALVAAAMVAGSFTGGLAAQYIDIRAPYLVLSSFAALCILANLIYWQTAKKRLACAESSYEMPQGVPHP